MRRTAVVVLTILLVVLFTACADGQTESGASSPASEPAISQESTTTALRTTTSGRSAITTTTTTVTTTTTTATQATQGEFEMPKNTIVGQEGDNNWIYRFGENGLIVRETMLDSGRGGEAVEIVQITDAHVSFFADERIRWKNCLRYAAEYDYTVATGDLIEGLHTDLTKYLQESLADNPNTMLVLGNHEWNPTKGTPEAMEDRYELLQEYWPNDVLYSSSVVKNKVMLIQLDNSQEKFHAEQIPKLKEDIQTARDKGYAVLLFYHVPLRSENPADAAVKALLPSNPNMIHSYNFQTQYLRGTSEDATGQVYDIITTNADVIKGAFCGHLHEDLYTEIVAKTATGESTVIPQYINHAARYGSGHVLKITVK